MKRIEIHPVSLLLGGLIVGGSVLLMGGDQTQRYGTDNRAPTLRARMSEEILSHMSIVYLDDGQGANVKTLRISDINVQVVNGTEDTETANGLGNLIVGYNELTGGGNDRTGSHTIVVGKWQDFSSYGGLVAGESNTLSAPFASVTGGFRNEAGGWAASVSGGSNNLADASAASVTGGEANTASAFASSVSGGMQRFVASEHHWCAGGLWQIY